MNKRIDFSNLGGLPLYQDTLEFLQSGFQGTFSGIANAIGSRVIISGVTDLGNDYSDGWVSIDGEILPFVGGLKAANITIEQIAELETMNDDSEREIYYTRRARTSSIVGVPVSSFIRISDLSALTTGLSALVNRVNLLAGVPKGIICMWSGSVSAVPSGWALCDGRTTGVPNLSGKFIVGYNSGDTDYSSIGNIGGEKKHPLTTNELPPHSHGYKDRYYIEKGAQTYSLLTNGHNGNAGSGDTDSDNQYFYYINATTDNTPASGPVAHENRPPYYTLAYIMKL